MYLDFLSALSAQGKARYGQELAAYQEVCTRMAGRYGQWSSQLLLEAPQIDEALPSYKHSSLIAAYTDHDASRKVKQLAKLRAKYLEDLRCRLHPDENERFGTMLQVKCPLGGFMPDIDGVQLIYKIDGLYQLNATVLEEGIRSQSRADAPMELLVEIGNAAVEKAFHETNKILNALAPDTSQFSDDSLTAKLLLAVALNRAQLEDLEYYRFDALATPSLIMMIRALSRRGIMVLDHVPCAGNGKRANPWRRWVMAVCR